MAGIRGYLLYLYGSIWQLRNNTVVRLRAPHFSDTGLRKRLTTQSDSEADITPVSLTTEYSCYVKFNCLFLKFLKVVLLLDILGLHY